MWPRDHTVRTACHASCPSTPYTLPAPRSRPHQPAVWSWRCFSDCHYGTSIVISLGLNWNHVVGEPLSLGIALLL